MKNIRVFLSQNFQFLEVKFSIYLNRRVFVMQSTYAPAEFSYESLLCIPCQPAENSVVCMRRKNCPLIAG